MNQKVFILSGPAGVGKTTLWENISHLVPHIGKIITSTTRSIRDWEKNGFDYHFLSRNDFENKIAVWDLIEYATVHNNLYGSTFSELERILSQKQCPIYIIEPQGMLSIKPVLEKKWYQVITIFILPPSLEELKNRLRCRGTETGEQCEIRIAKAITELWQQDLYDIKIVNDSIEDAQKQLIKVLS